MKTPLKVILGICLIIVFVVSFHIFSRGINNNQSGAVFPFWNLFQTNSNKINQVLPVADHSLDRTCTQTAEESLSRCLLNAGDDYYGKVSCYLFYSNFLGGCNSNGGQGTTRLEHECFIKVNNKYHIDPEPTPPAPLTVYQSFRKEYNACLKKGAISVY